MPLGALVKRKLFSVLFLLGSVALLVLIFYVPKHFLNLEASSAKPSIKLIDKMESEGAGDFVFQNFLDKKSYKLSELNKKIIIVNFWASWCAPCLEEMPSLISLAKKFDKDLVIVAVSGDNTEKELELFIRSFPEMKRQNIFIVLSDANQIMQNFGVERLPESFILNRKLKLKKKIIGSINWYTEDSVNYLSTF